MVLVYINRILHGGGGGGGVRQVSPTLGQIYIYIQNVPAKGKKQRQNCVKRCVYKTILMTSAKFGS